MRDEHIEIPVSCGAMRVVIAAEALLQLREGAVFQDGPSLVRTYRSVIAEIAREKAEDGMTESDGSVRISAQDIVG